MKINEAVVVILIVALGVSFVFDYSLYSSNQQLSASFANLNQSFYNLNQKYNELAAVLFQSTSVTNESLGLNFSMATNTTFLQSRQAISISLSETNTLPNSTISLQATTGRIADFSQRFARLV